MNVYSLRSLEMGISHFSSSCLYTSSSPKKGTPLNLVSFKTSIGACLFVQFLLSSSSQSNGSQWSEALSTKRRSDPLALSCWYFSLSLSLSLHPPPAKPFAPLDAIWSFSMGPLVSGWLASVWSTLRSWVCYGGAVPVWPSSIPQNPQNSVFCTLAAQP